MYLFIYLFIYLAILNGKSKPSEFQNKTLWADRKN